MAEEQDQSQKTEEPTEKKLEDARKKGNLPVSREVATSMTILAGLILTAFFSPSFTGTLGETLIPIVANLHQIEVMTAEGDIRSLVLAIAAYTAGALAVIFAFFIGGAFLAGYLQNTVRMAPDRIKPKLERVSIPKGFSRLFSLSSLVEFAKSVAKVLAVGTVVGLIVFWEMESVERMAGYEAFVLPELIRELTVKLLFAVLLIYAVITVLDVLWRRFDWRRKLKMTRQEVKDEFKQMEGDPHVKAKLKEIRRERSKKRMMADVPKASVVLMNPTHYAVALKYERGELPAPLCLAKGTDAVALKIREVAEEAGVPVVENPELTRALYATVDIGGFIPAEHYKLVAEILTFVFKQKKRAV